MEDMPTRILLVGAGAIGAFFASRLSQASQTRISALCRSNYAAVKTHGFKITSPKFGNYTFRPEFTFSSPEEVRRTQKEKDLRWDYLVVATKALPDVSDDSKLLDGLVGEDSCVVLVQNGIGIEEPYRRRFPKASILSGVTIASCVQSRPGVIEHSRWTRISIGPYLPHLDSGGKGAQEGDEEARRRCEEFVRLLKEGGVEDAESFSHADLQFLRWHKVAINAAMNPSAVMSGGSGNQELALDPELAIHTKAIMDEVLSAAPKIMGKEFPWKEMKLPTPEQIMKSVSRNDSGSRPSMYWDWVEGRRMELEVILGNPLRMARERGIEMARVQSLYALLRKAQERRDGSRSKM